MNPMRFYLVFDVEGNASEELSRLSSQFIELGQAGMTAGSGVESFHGSVIAAIHGLRQIEELGHGMMSWGEGLIGTMGTLAHSTLDTAATFESLRARMGFAFDGNADAVWQNINDYAVNSVYRFGEVADVVGGLGVAIRGLGNEFAQLPAKYTPRSGAEMINALQVMGDVASGTGRQIGFIGFEVEQMMSGMFRGAHQVLRLTQEETDTIKHLVKGTHDSAVQFSGIMDVLAAHYGGATAAMGRTLQFQLLQIPDVMEILQSKIGGPGLEYLNQSVGELVTWLRQLGNDAPFIKAVSDAFVMVADGASKALHLLIEIGREVQSFVSHNPEVVKFAVILAGITGTLMVVGGLLLSTAAGVGVFAASISLAGGAIFTAFGAATGTVAALAAGIGALIAFGGMLHTAYAENLGGIATRFQQISLIVQALGEAIHHWDGDFTAISSGMAERLQQNGLLDFFVNMVSWIRRAEEWWRGFIDGIREGWSRINWGGMTEGFASIERALTSIGISLHLLEPAAATSFDSMRERGYNFAELVNNVLVPALNMLVSLFQFAGWSFEHVILPALSAGADAARFLMQNLDGVKGIAAMIALYFFPIPTLIMSIISATGTWSEVLSGVAAVFRDILDVAGWVGSAITNMMGGIGSIVSGPPSQEDRAPRGYVHQEEGPSRTSTGSMVYDPYEHGIPTMVNDSGGSSTEQTPQQLRVTMPNIPGGGSGEGGGGFPGIHSREDLISAMREAQEQALNSHHQRNPQNGGSSGSRPRNDVYSGASEDDAGSRSGVVASYPNASY